MSIDLAVFASEAWPSSMPPPSRGDWRVSTVLASCFAAGVTPAERSELLTIAADCKRYFAGELSSAERRRVEGLRGRVAAIARRHGMADVITEAANAAVREPGLGSVERHGVRACQATAQLMLRLHVAGLCAYADAEL